MRVFDQWTLHQWSIDQWTIDQRSIEELSAKMKGGERMKDLRGGERMKYCFGIVLVGGLPLRPERNFGPS